MKPILKYGNPWKAYPLASLAIGTSLLFCNSSAAFNTGLHHLSSSRRRIHQQQQTAQTQTQSQSQSQTRLHADRVRDIRFAAPLIEEGYPPVVETYENGTLSSKPLLLYLPGFDGTFMAPFLQLPELSTSFDVRCLTMSMNDRSTYEELKSDAIQFLSRSTHLDHKHNHDHSDQNNRPPQDNTNQQKSGRRGNFLDIFTQRKRKRKQKRPVYLAGESFGGILSLDMALTILQQENLDIDLKGLTLINPATCYDRSKLASKGPSVVALSPFLYNFGLLSLLPLFTDDYALPQLLMILQSKALPSVIDTPAREAYMGRVAASIPSKLKYMSQSTLDWRLNEWLTEGSTKVAAKLENFAETNNNNNRRKMVPTLIVAGEKDLCLPSIDEAERLSALLPGSIVHVVEGAGHASTCGGRVDLAALMRDRFPEVKGRREMKATASRDPGVSLGMEPRYDGNVKMGLSPLKYWTPEFYRQANLTEAS